MRIDHVGTKAQEYLRVMNPGVEKTAVVVETLSGDRLVIYVAGLEGLLIGTIRDVEVNPQQGDKFWLDIETGELTHREHTLVQAEGVSDILLAVNNMVSGKGTMSAVNEEVNKEIRLRVGGAIFPRTMEAFMGDVEAHIRGNMKEVRSFSLEWYENQRMSKLDPIDGKVLA